MKDHSTNTGRGMGALLFWATLALALCSFADPKDGAPLAPPLPAPPLPRPLTVTGGFGEYRIGHFHAGVDLGTRQHVGMHVMAPASGWVERIRASGVGYGRSVYLHTDDGRLIQLGHLDAFVEPLASYVRAKQDSSGQYEQDLWPERDRFRFRAGQQVAWSGQSGAGGPHLHMEIRRGDMAYHPLRAGLLAVDNAAPSVVDLTLEPLDDASFVEGSAAPHTKKLGARPDTMRVIGRVRAVVGARDGVWRGVDRMVPWSVGMEWEGRETECRFDSVSWATDMVESDYVYDSGRVIGEKGIMLWAPAGFRPRMIRSSVPHNEEAGTIVVHRGDPPRALRLWARDLAGNHADRTVTVAPGRSEIDTTGTLPKPVADPGSALELVSLPGGWLRVTARNVPQAGKVVRIVAGGVERIARGSVSTRGVTAVVPMSAPREPGPWWAVIGSEGSLGRSAGWMSTSTFRVAAGSPRESVVIEAHSYRVRVPAEALFEPALMLARGDGSPPASSRDLLSASPSLMLEPASLPLRRALKVGIACPPTGIPRDVALYRRGEDGWEWIGGSFDSTREEFAGESRRLGEFALMRDTLAPRISLGSTPRRAPKTEYPTWAVEATVTENGSGLDGRASHFEIDGHAVPTEWDAEEQVLRWRPARTPRKGTHQVEAIAVDRAGNVGRALATFVLD